MKNLYFFVALALTCGLAQAQTVTSYGGLQGVGTTAGTVGLYNSHFGHDAGNITTGPHNTFIGYQSGYLNAGGSQNTFLGSGSGYSNTANNNSFVGYRSGYSNTTGGNNTLIGYQSGYSLTDGSGNIFLGYQAGYNETGSNRLYIANSSTATPLIWGDFANNYLTVNGSLGVNTSAPTAGLDVNGSARIRTLNQNNAHTRVLVADVNGNLNWRDAATLNTDSQSLYLSGNTLNLTGSGTGISLAPYLDNTDNQMLSVNSAGTTRTITISGGNGVNINVADNDDNPANEIQQLSFVAGIISLSNDPTSTLVDLSGYDNNLADDFSGSFADLANVPVNLDTDSTDDFSGDFANLINVPAGLADGDDVDDADADPANELQTLSFAGGVITLSNDPTLTSIDLSGYDNNAADDFNGSFTSLTNVPAGLADGDDVNDADADPANEYNTGFQVNGTNLEITDAGGTLSVPVASLGGIPHDFPSYPASAGDGGGNTNSYFGEQAGVSTTGTANTLMGYQSGFANTLGTNNAAYGYQALRNNTTAGSNTAIGTNALYTQSFNNNGAAWNTDNVAVGYQALYNNNPDANNSGNRNTAIGTLALYSNTTGGLNTATGYGALSANTIGSLNTANGYQTLFMNTIGAYNTATGYQALFFNTTGIYNTSSGYQTLYNNTTASYNVAIGTLALANQNYNNGGISWGSYNVAVGYEALYTNNPTATFNGIYNTAIGAQALRNNTTGYWNTANGYQALYSNTTGYFNTATGYQALFFNTTGTINTANGVAALLSNTTGSYNTANGMNALRTNSIGNNNTATGATALYSNTSGSGNTANGTSALFNNTTGSNNTATGLGTLNSNTTGNYNTAHGAQALSSNTTGEFNTANGFNALQSNTVGNTNTANGAYALASNTTGGDNTANGYQALYANTTGGNNTANGWRALYSNTGGNNNNANGVNALYSNTTGNVNTAAGNGALYNNTIGGFNTATGNNSLVSNTTGSQNTAIGVQALYANTTGSNNTVLGCFAGPANGNGAFDNSTAIGYSATITASNQVRIGDASVISIGGFVNWTNVSDERFKKEMKEDVAGLAFIEKLRPVSYELDRQKLHVFLRGEDSEPLAELPPAERSVGFIAQEVEKVVNENRYVFSGVNKPQNERDHYGLRYAEFVVPLTKAVQELSAKDKVQQQLIETQQQQLEEQKQENATLRQRVEALESALYGASVKTPNASGKTTGEAIQTLPEGFALYQNVPNPFDRTTVIGAQLPENVQQAKIVVYNLQGLELASYPLGERGKVSVEISGGRFPAGMYLYALLADGQVMDTKKMILTE